MEEGKLESFRKSAFNGVYRIGRIKRLWKKQKIGIKTAQHDDI